MTPEIQAQFQDVLSLLYPDEVSIRRIVAETGIKSTRIALNSSAVNNWYAVLSEAQKLGQIESLLNVIAAEYGDNPDFQNARNAYSRAAVESSQGEADRAPRTAPQESQARVYAQENDRQRRISHSILPWLVNRSEQMDVLRLALRQLERAPNRPVLCLLHGDDQECHDKFIDRLKEVSLPDLLPELRAKGPIRRISLDWPTHAQSVAELHDKLTMRLAEAVQDIQANLDEINAHFSASPVLVESYLLIQEWSTSTPTQIKGFVEFWQKWPPLLSGQYLIVCLCLKCIQPKPSLWSFWRRSNIEEIVNQVGKVLQDGSTFAFERYDRVLCQVLPRLQSITLQDAYHWPRLEAVMRSCPGRDLLEELQAIFNHDPKKTLPMREVGRRLGELLTLSTPSQEREQ